MPLADVADSLWYGDTRASRLTRVILAPLSAAFGAVVARRNAAYDSTPPAPAPIPSISIGNLTVGGTGKTPMSAWFAQRFRDAGAKPAIVMRGYGDDEVLVHRLLNPDVPVYGNADRSAGVLRAAADGADIAILDDAFQHRRAARVCDVVLVSADRWTGDVRLLPAGPFREPLHALRRAQLVIVTVKAAPEDRVAAAERAVRAVTKSTVVTVDLTAASFSVVKPDAHCSEPAIPRPGPASWNPARVLAVSGIGDPSAFERQLHRLGLRPRTLVFPDHHPYDAHAVQRIVQASAGMDAVVCTLKDAVKLGPQWPSSAIPLWYLSQSVVPRDGVEALDDVVRSVLEARRSSHSFPDLSR